MKRLNSNYTIFKSQLFKTIGNLFEFVCLSERYSQNNLITEILKKIHSLLRIIHANASANLYIKYANERTVFTHLAALPTGWFTEYAAE